MCDPAESPLIRPWNFQLALFGSTVNERPAQSLVGFYLEETADSEYFWFVRSQSQRLHHAVVRSNRWSEEKCLNSSSSSTNCSPHIEDSNPCFRKFSIFFWLDQRWSSVWFAPRSQGGPQSWCSTSSLDDKPREVQSAGLSRLGIMVPQRFRNCVLDVCYAISNVHCHRVGCSLIHPRMTVESDHKCSGAVVSLSVRTCESREESSSRQSSRRGNIICFKEATLVFEETRKVMQSLFCVVRG